MNAGLAPSYSTIEKDSMRHQAEPHVPYRTSPKVVKPQDKCDLSMERRRNPCARTNVENHKAKILPKREGTVTPPEGTVTPPTIENEGIVIAANHLSHDVSLASFTVLADSPGPHTVIAASSLCRHIDMSHWLPT